ncbi:Hypothetical predicted protein [Olea europaea subsp. europaea]|uniref:Uncharacterized protein n=1 Tax=Olea europaea subsp. europaea TaxID=158383 RepID=A0A8S0Q2D5_OLEEU|nr:Hypothetical predicted protein [Olea europaea subsp. europaea]
MVENTPLICKSRGEIERKKGKKSSSDPSPTDDLDLTHFDLFGHTSINWRMPFSGRMEYHMDNDLRAHLGKVTTYCNFSSYATVIEGLDEEHIDILHRSFLWSFYSLKDMQFSG